MSPYQTFLRGIIVIVMVVSTLLVSSCVGARLSVGQRVYDPYRRDYHYWDANEGGLYTQWTVETHRDGRRDLRRLDRRDRDEYWRWRHDHR